MKLCHTCDDLFPVTGMATPTECEGCHDPGEAYDRFLSRFYGGEDPTTVREQHRAAHEMDRNPNDPRW